MNERIRELALELVEQCDWNPPHEPTYYTFAAEDLEKFAELIVQECMRVALDEIVSNEDIDNTKLIEDRCYLQGNNGGVVDVVVAIKQHFGVEE